MRIIINQPRTSYFVGGAEMISIDHAINLCNLGNDVYFITINPKSVMIEYSKKYKNFYNKYKDKIHFVELDQPNDIAYLYKIQPGEDRMRWNIESIKYSQELYKYLLSSKQNYDVLFSYYNLDGCFFQREKIKINVLYLCGIPREQNDFQGSFLHCYDKVIAISDEVKLSWEKYSKNEIHVISTGVDCEKFFPVSKKDSGIIKLLYVGRLIERKNVSCIINVYNKLKNDYNIQLTIVGDGPNRKELEKLSDDVIFAGVVTNTEKYYQESDIFLSPSLYGEGLQGTILEAMSSGLTVIATNTKINSELLNDGRGFTISPDETSVEKAIIQAINSDRSNIADKSREYIFNNYSWINKANEIMEELK